MTVPQRTITKQKVVSGRYAVLVDGKQAGFIIRHPSHHGGGWGYLTPSGWHGRNSRTMRAAFEGAENYLNCRP